MKELRFTFMLDAEELKIIEEMAKEFNRSKSDAIRELLRIWKKGKEKKTV